MGVFLRYVRPDEMWSRTGTLSASSAATGYPATNAQNGDPAHPWWATSTTASITASFGSATVGVVALIQPNVDAGNTVSITGGAAASLTGAVGAGGYPRNLAAIMDPSVTASSITAAVSGNSANVAIGEFVVGNLRSMAFPIFPASTRSRTRAVVDDTNTDFAHTIRYDYGSELWSMEGKTFCDDAELANQLAWWESTKGGFLPTLIIPNTVDSEPRLVRMEMSWTHSNDGSNQHQITYKFIEVARGMLVV